jgi:hydroxymethylpyrimidine pyrophosphatase-like HAD family hydrolase
MALNSSQLKLLQEFFIKTAFSEKGAVITDLDGTAVHELEGLTVIHKDIEIGLKKIYDTGRPVVINTLRFPLSVIRTFGKEWYKISGKPIPVVLLNGSQLGFIVSKDEEFGFEQLAAFPLEQEEINHVLENMTRLQGSGIRDMLLFYYPEDWLQGEIIWTPDADRIPALREKYKSASTVLSLSLAALKERLEAAPICMILLLIEASQDRLMAYQHTKGNNFFTRKGVDKLFGAQRMAEHLGFAIEDALGAGDSGMDIFLNATGLAVHVHNNTLPFKGRMGTIHLKDFHDFGDTLTILAGMQERLQLIK